MIGLDSLASERLCLTLLHSLWQVGFLALAAWGIGLALGRRRENASYVVHATALVLGLIATPITHAVISFGESMPRSESALPAVVVATVPLDSAPGVSQLPPEFAAVAVAEPPSLATTPTAQTNLPVTTAAGFAWQSIVPWLAGAYMLGVVLMLARLAWSAYLLERLRASAQPIVDGPVFKALADICRRWSLKTAPALARAEQVVVPKVVGLLKPTILLPSSALTGLPIDDLELILAHELAHVRRHDLWINLLQRLAEAVLFFNPAIWWLSRRVSTLREYCCDDRACGVIPEGAKPQLRYAEALLHAVELQGANRSQRAASLAATGRSPSELRRRVARLFGEPLNESSRISRGGFAVLITGAAMLLFPPTVADSSLADSPKSETGSETLDEESDELAGLPIEADANRVVARARTLTFGLNRVPKVAFVQVYRQAEAPGMQSHPDDKIASLWKARRSQIAAAEFDRNRHETKLAWDQGKLLLESFTRHRPNHSWRQTHYWDGEEGWIGETSNTKEGLKKNVYRYAALDKLIDHVAPFYYPHWAAAGDRLPWPGPTVLLEEHGVDPAATDYRYAGETRIDGVLCDIYDGPQRHEKVWVERQTGLMKAISRHYVRDMSQDENLKAINQAAQREFRDVGAYRAWYEKQSADKKAALHAAWCAATWDRATPGNLTVFSDYREVAADVRWPHEVDRIEVHPNHRGDDTYRYSVARITVTHQSEFDIEALASNSLPEPGVKVTDRRFEANEVRNEFYYEWSSTIDDATIDRLRAEKLAEVQAKQDKENRINATPINSVNDAIRILTEGPKTDPTKVWARGIKYLADHPEPALPALIETLDDEDRDHPISKLAFALRAIGDARAVPALIRALPRTLQPSRSDYALIIEDVELCRFMQQHDGNGKPRPGSNYFDYGRAFREVVFSLRRLTGKQFDEMDLNWIRLKGTDQQRRLAQGQFDRVAEKWAAWWESDWELFVKDSAYSKVGLAKRFQPGERPIVARRPPSGPGVELLGAGSGGIIQSVHDRGKACFVDLDTRRQADWPSELPQLVKMRLDSPELLAWARREGYDLVGITHTPDGEEEPLYCLKPLDLRAWKITEGEHRELPDAVRGKRPYPLTKSVDLLIPRRTIPKPRDPKHSGDSFLFVTREGTAGVLRLTAQVTEAKNITGRFSSPDDVFKNEGFHRGVKYVLKTMSAPAIAEVDRDADAAATNSPEESSPDLREMRIRILDESGKPLAGAKLFANAVRPPEAEGDRIVNRHLVANEKGFITLPINRQADTVKLWAGKEGYVSEFVWLRHPEKPEGRPLPALFDFRLARGTRIGGVVVDAEGRPIPGVSVRVNVEQERLREAANGEPQVDTWLSDGNTRPALVTDSEGRWELTNAPGPDQEAPYVFKLKFSHGGYTDDREWGQLQREQGVTTEMLRDGSARITMTRGSRITGVVTDLQGNPVTKGWVVWSDEPYFNDGVFEAEINEDGSFKTLALPDGEYPITIVAPGFASQRRLVKTGTDATDLRFELKQGKRIELRFVDKEGKPIPKAGVYLANSSFPNTWEGSNALHNHKHSGVPDYGIARRSDENGVFVWDWAPEEAVTYSVGAKGFAPKSVALVAKSEPHVITLAESRVAHGKVTDASTGQTIAKFQAIPVIVFREDFFSTRFVNVKQGVDGQYELPLAGSGDPDDAYRVRFEAKGYRSVVSDESFGPYDGRAELNIQLEPAAGRPGRVVEAEGNLVAGATVLEGTPTWVPTIRNNEPDSYGERILRTDADGRFQLTATSEPVRVRVVHEKGFAEKLLDPADESIGDLKLQPWARVSG